MDEDNTQQTYDETQDAPQDEQNDETLTNESEAESVEQPVEQEVVTEEAQPEQDEEDEGYNPLVGTYQPGEVNLPAFDFSTLPVDDNGNISVDELAKSIQSQVAAATQAAVSQATALVNQSEERRLEERLWQKATDKYPELKDKQYAADVQAYRFGKFNMDLTSNGAEAKMMTPAQAAAAFNKRFGAAKAEGMRQSTENVRVQDSVYIEPTSGATATNKNSSEELVSRMRSPDRAEAEAASQEWIKNRLFGS